MLLKASSYITCIQRLLWDVFLSLTWMPDKGVSRTDLQLLIFNLKDCPLGIFNLPFLAMQLNMNMITQTFSKGYAYQFQ